MVARAKRCRLPWEMSPKYAQGSTLETTGAGFAEPILRLFTADPDVIGLGIGLLAIGAGFQMFDGLQVVAIGVLRGLGDTRTPVVVNVGAENPAAGATVTTDEVIAPRVLWSGVQLTWTSSPDRTALTVGAFGVGGSD